MIKVALIALFPSDKFSLIGESHGICVISGFLKKTFGEDVDVKLFDQQIHTNEAIIESLHVFRPDLIGFSVKIGTLYELEHIYTEVSEIKTDSNCKPLIVLGNSIAHFNAEYLLNKYPSSIISYGEGEVCFSDLVYALKKGFLDKRTIRNIAFLSDSRIVRTKFEYLQSSKISKADRSNTQRFYKQGGEIYIEGSRGCNYCGCSICECRLLLGSRNKEYKWRPKNISEIIDEINQLISLGIKTVTFSDEDFWGDDNAGKEHVNFLAERLINNNLRIEYRVNLRVHSIFRLSFTSEQVNTSIRTLQHLKESGLTKVFLGFESGSQRQLERYNKGFLLEEFIVAKKILDNLGIEYELGYISFDPFMTLEELEESLYFIDKNQCVDSISNIFKELRIQRGNDSYLMKILKYESEHNCKIIGPLDLNEQIFPVIHYIDKRIDTLVKILRDYEEGMYKLYYRLRILTQYSNENAGKAIKHKHSVMKKIKELDYVFLISCIESIKGTKGITKLHPLLEKFKGERERIILDCLSSIEMNFDSNS